MERKGRDDCVKGIGCEWERLEASEVFVGYRNRRFKSRLVSVEHGWRGFGTGQMRYTGLERYLWCRRSLDLNAAIGVNGWRGSWI